MKKDVNIEYYLSSTRYTTRKELCEKTNLCDREVRQRISELKKTRVLIFSSGGKGYRLAKEYKSMSRLERDEELNQIRRSLNECKSRTNQINKQKRKYIAYVRKAEEIEKEELKKENEKHYISE